MKISKAVATVALLALAGCAPVVESYGTLNVAPGGTTYEWTGYQHKTLFNLVNNSDLHAEAALCAQVICITKIQVPPRTSVFQELPHPYVTTRRQRLNAIGSVVFLSPDGKRVAVGTREFRLRKGARYDVEKWDLRRTAHLPREYQ